MTKFSEISSFVTFFLFLSPLGVHGLKLPFERRAPRGASMTSPRSAMRYSFGSMDKETLDNKEDIRYAANITINGKQVPVALDTGSTDLWVNPPDGIGAFNNTQIPLRLGYGDGSYGVSGNIGVSPFELGTYEVPRQAFLNVTRSTFRGLAEYGLYGMLGLSFDFASASHIKTEIQERYGSSATWGKSVLYNIFEHYPSQPNLIAMHLSRTDDLEDTNGGSFMIGEYDPDYASVQNAPKLPQYPDGGDRWTTLLEGLYVDGKSIPLKSRIRGVPDGRVQPMLDTGVPTALFPAAIWEAIYSSIPGAVQYSNTLWLVPCNATTLVEFVFGGQRFPMHPLDLTNITEPYDVNGSPATSCVSAFQVLPSHWGGTGYEILLGASFLRNVYSVYNFGDASSSNKPYMQLLSITDPTKAVSQVATIRQRTMADLPPELPPSEVVRLLKPSATSSDANEPTSTAKSLAKAPDSGSLAEDNSFYTTFGIGAEDIKKYGIIALSLLGANVLIGLVLLVLLVLVCVRRGTARSSRPTAQYVPVKLQDEGSESVAYPPRYDT